MTFALPPLDQWPDLTPDDVEILSPGAADADGRWEGDTPFVLRIHRLWNVLVQVGSSGLLLRDVALRPHSEGMGWSGCNQIGAIDLAPQDLETATTEYGSGAFHHVQTIVLPPRASTPEARRDVFLRAFSRAVGPDARRRLAAFQALARARLLVEGARTAVLRPLYSGGPRLLIHRSNGSTSTQSLFRRADGGKRTPPDAATLLLDGACRQIVGDLSGDFLRTCEDVRIRIQEIPSRHAVLAAAEDAIAQFDALGHDVRPWIVRRAR